MARRARLESSFKAVATPDSSYKQDIAQTVQQTAGVVVQTIQKQDQLKMANYSAQLDAQMQQVTQEWRNQNADDPTNAQSMEKLKKQYTKMFAEYDDKISFTSRGAWKQVQAEMINQYGVSNQDWALAQNVKNAETNANAAKQSTVNQVYGYGMQGDYDNAMRLTNNSTVAIQEGLDGVVPVTQIQEIVSGMRSDATKSFVLGQMETNPDKAEELLKREDVRDAIGNEESQKMLTKAIKAKKAQLKLEQDQQQFNSQASFDEFTSDMTIGQKLRDLEAGKQEGRYDSKWAKTKRNAILSTQGLTPEVREDIYTQYLEDMGLLLAGIGKGNTMNGQEFLNGSKQLQNALNESVSRGEIDPKKADSINRALAKKRGAAAQKIDVGTDWWFHNDFADGVQVLNKSLDGLAREKAIIELYEKTEAEDNIDYSKTARQLVGKYKNGIALGEVQVRPESYTMGQTVYAGGKKYKVVGVDDPTNPQLEEVK